MEILTSKYSYFSPSFRTPKSSTAKGPLSFDSGNASNKENLVVTLKKEKSTLKVEEKSTNIARSSSIEKKQPQQSSHYTAAKQNEPLTSSSLMNFPSALVFNSPRYEPTSFFSSQDKNSYKAKYMNKPSRNSSKLEEKPSNQDQYIHSKVDKIVESSISGKDKPKTASNDRNSSTGPQFDENHSKTNIYSRLATGISSSTPKARESNGFEHTSKSNVQRSSVDFFRNPDKKDSKITTSEPDEKIRDSRVNNKLIKPVEEKRGDPSRERDEGSNNGLLRQPQSTKNIKQESRLSESQSLAESLSQIKKSSFLGKSSLKNVAIYNNFVRDDSKEPKTSPKSITPKASIKASEPKSFFQTMKVSSPKGSATITLPTSKEAEKKSHSEVNMTPAKSGTPKTGQRTTDSASNQRPSSQKDRDSAKKNEEPVKTQPTSSLKSFVTQVNPGFSIIKTKAEEKPMNLQPQSTKNSSSSKVNIDSKLVTLSNTTNILKVPNTTTSAESKSFTFAKTEKPQPKSFLEPKSETQNSNYQYYMTGLEKYLKAPNSGDEYYSKIYREHFMQSVQAINFCKYLKAVDPRELAKKKVYLPKRESHKDKKTIVFDLDETLIHCNENVNMPCDVVLPIKFPHGDIIEAGINVRPYAIECLEELNKYFEIIVFTASHSCYANVVLDYLDPQGKYIHHRLFRDNCVTTEEGLYIKDLRVFANRNLKDIVLVDNAAYSFGYQIDNGIPVIPFYYNKTDTELKSLIPFLKSLYTVRDVREVCNRTFKLHTIMETENQDEIIDRLFTR